MWTQFWDMHSGGRTKQAPFEKIYIEAPEDEAGLIFYNRFGHSPHRVTCTCCGEDYSVSQGADLNELTAYQRNATNSRSRWAVITPEDFAARPDVLIIASAEIEDSERRGSVPVEGYVWEGS